MRILTILTACAVLCAPLVPAIGAQSAPASAASGMPACDGVYNIMRVSDITPTGSMEKFMAAVAAQKAWYQSHGSSDVIFAAPLLVRDPQTHAMSYSTTEAVTYHYRKPGSQPVAENDAAWDAFVKMYRDTSTIKQTLFQCVPAEGAPASLK